MEKEDIIKYIKHNLHSDAKNEIVDIFCDFLNSEDTAYVCNAPMGHGKTTILTATLKAILEDRNNDTGILLAVNDLDAGKSIKTELAKINKSVLFINHENVLDHDKDLIKKCKILIITHKRLYDMATNRVNAYHFINYLHGNRKKYKKRMLIIDEKPIFIDSSIFDITAKNNGVNWIDKYADSMELDVFKTQLIKSQVITLLADQLSNNINELTLPLKNSSLISEQSRSIISDFLTKCKGINEVSSEAKRELRHFSLIYNFKHKGVIDDYKHGGRRGRKIIVSEYVDYKKLGLDILILDGTAHITEFYYKDNYILREVYNYNDYKRLTLTQCNINTSKDSRNRKDKSTQKVIASYIRELNDNNDNNMFILPMKDDIKTYNELGIIPPDYKCYFEDSKHYKSVNLLNTTGKNMLRDVNDLFLTSLPRMMGDYYKEIAIAIYEITDLKMNDKKDSPNWFNDLRLEYVYLKELVAELMQIIHRTSLRNIGEYHNVNTYVAFKDFDMRILKLMNNYLKSEANLKHIVLNNDELYGFREKIEQFGEFAIKYIEENKLKFPIKLSTFGDEGNKFKEFIKQQKKNNNIDIKKINAHLKQYDIRLTETRNKLKTLIINKIR